MKVKTRLEKQLHNFEIFKDQLNYIYKNNKIYKNKLKSSNIMPSDIKSINDIAKLPLTTKQDFFIDYPYGFYSVSKEKIVRFHSSSGSTGKSLIVGFTQKDIELRNKMVMDNCIKSGITKDDVVQICVGYGMFTGGLGYHEGLSSLGCTIIPVSCGNTEKQLFYIQTLNTTVLITSPSYAMHLYEISQKLGIDLKKTKLRMIKVGSELLTEKMRRLLKKSFGNNIVINQDYGMTETMGPGLGNECICCNGMHIYDKNFIYELIDPITKEPTDDIIGELVITTLNNECFPLIRYATNDIVVLDESKCSCGNKSVKIKKIIGRADDMIKIKGVKIYISQVEDFILKHNFCSSNYEIILTTNEYIDNIKIRIEYNSKLNFNEKIVLKKQIILENEFKNTFGIKADIELLENKTITRKIGKVKRIKDLRNKNLVKNAII